MVFQQCFFNSPQTDLIIKTMFMKKPNYCFTKSLLGGNQWQIAMITLFSFDYMIFDATLIHFWWMLDMVQLCV